MWRLISMGLLHTDMQHLVLNMMWLVYTGWNIERALGRVNLATLYFVAVLGGALLSMFGSPETQSLGASGGVYGLIGASVVFGFVRPELLPRRGRRLFGVAILPYLVLMFWSGLMNEQTDNWAHLGGLLSGASLVLLLDPDPLQRRPGWNLRVRGTILGISVLVLALIGVLGPRLEGIADVESVRAVIAKRRGGRPPPAPDADAFRAVTYDVPRGWKPGLDLAGGSAFTSPVGGGKRRAWAVRDGGGDRLTSAEALGAAWVEKLLAEYPAAEIGAFESDVVAGHAALRVMAVVGDEQIVWRGAARGTWTLQEVWQVDAGRAGRLAPLVARLRASLVWDDPQELRAARLDVEHLPQSPKTRGRLASALTRIGELEAAFELHEALVAEAPRDVERWLSVLDSVAVADGVIDDTDAWLARALDATTSMKVVVAVSDTLRDGGREEMARGLLQIAWVGAPGDRTLRRARRRLGLPTELDGTTGEPWDLVNDPTTGLARPDADVEDRRRWAMTLDNAAEVGAAWVVEQAEVAEAAAVAIAALDPAALVPLLVLREGHVPTVDADLREAVAGDLERAVGGSPPGWMPRPVSDAIVAHPDFAEVLRGDG